jgi:hypothetical protein
MYSYEKAVKNIGIIPYIEKEQNKKISKVPDTVRNIAESHILYFLYFLDFPGFEDTSETHETNKFTYIAYSKKEDIKDTKIIIIDSNFRRRFLFYLFSLPMYYSPELQKDLAMFICLFRKLSENRRNPNLMVSKSPGFNNNRKTKSSLVLNAAGPESLKNPLSKDKYIDNEDLNFGLEKVGSQKCEAVTQAENILEKSLNNQNLFTNIAYVDTYHPDEYLQQHQQLHLNIEKAKELSNFEVDEVYLNNSGIPYKACPESNMIINNNSSELFRRPLMYDRESIHHTDSLNRQDNIREISGNDILNSSVREENDLLKLEEMGNLLDALCDDDFRLDFNSGERDKGPGFDKSSESASSYNKEFVKNGVLNEEKRKLKEIYWSPTKENTTYGKENKINKTLDFGRITGKSSFLLYK